MTVLTATVTSSFMLYVPKQIEHMCDAKFYIPANLSACFISGTTWSIQVKFDTGTLAINRYSWQLLGYNKIVLMA
jgi:hypothetical protein